MVNDSMKYNCALLKWLKCRDYSQALSFFLTYFTTDFKLCASLTQIQKAAH